MTTSQDWWPADFGHYGPLFIRMSWHAAGTYRVNDGRGGGGAGMQRFAPLNSWPDNVSLDKARRLLWPREEEVRQEAVVGRPDRLRRQRAPWSRWASRPPASRSVAKIVGSLRRTSTGVPRSSGSTDKRYTGKRDLENPLARSPDGSDLRQSRRAPTAIRIPLAAAIDIRETFGRMAMNDVETAALIVGGHTFGKTHGNGDAELVGPEPEAAPLERGPRLEEPSGHRCRQGRDHQRARGHLDPHAHQVGQQLPGDPLRQRVGADQEPRGSQPVEAEGRRLGQLGAGGLRHRQDPPVDADTDLALRIDPIYERITRRWLDHPEELAEEFAKAWFKLLHRDMGPVVRYLGPAGAAADLAVAGHRPRRQ